LRPSRTPTSTRSTWSATASPGRSPRSSTPACSRPQRPTRGRPACSGALESDGGASWTRNWAAFSACSGGDPDYPRTTDPWVSYDAGGRLYQIALSIDSAALGLSAVLASTSTNDGATWSAPETIQRDENSVNFNDKESITGDWTREDTAYAVWGGDPGR
jgi:hypothetical protein